MSDNDVREKLVGIVKKAAYSSLPSNTEDFHLNMFVTNLLSHGVTVQEWISVDDRLPRNYTPVLAYIPSLALCKRFRIYDRCRRVPASKGMLHGRQRIFLSCSG